ncbi:MAG: PGPGW domain-containing protein [Phycisphaerae bacterium]|nr:PGPGW domain-containing protein [Phycisphaerae bacterium]
MLKRNARRLRVLIVGTSIILVGIVISPLPGPGLSVLGPIGLAILASEFVWARTLAVRIRTRGEPIHDAARRIARGTPRWTVPPVCLGYWGAIAAVEVWTPAPTVVLWPAASILFTPVMLWAYLVFRGSRAPEKPPDQREGP